MRSEAPTVNFPLCREPDARFGVWDGRAVGGPRAPASCCSPLLPILGREPGSHSVFSLSFGYHRHGL